jgi:hypothetical protein
MPKYTIELDKEDLVLINVVKSIMGLKNIDQAIGFIMKDYAENNEYSKFIKSKKKKGGEK